MAKEEKPLEYQRRILDTKGVVQRLDLDYLKKPSPFRDWKRKLTWIAPLAAAAGVVPFLTGIGSLDKAFSNGPVSRSHSVFESNCKACHVNNFSSVPDSACQACHDGPRHPAKIIDTGKPNRALSCATCHLEHRDSAPLAQVADRNCTTCHSDLRDNGTNVKLAGVSVTGFAEGKHPKFSTEGGSRKDARPLKLSHAKHMARKTVRNIKLEMKCSDCHLTNTDSRKGDMMAVTFDRCAECHRKELQFDVYDKLGENAEPSPHTGDVQKIREVIAGTYQKAVAANPAITNGPLGLEYPPAGAQAWLEKVIRDSEKFLFERKCNYCHEYEGQSNGYPVVKKVAPILGQYVAGKPAGDPWLLRGEFSHRAHRAVDCSGCHSSARSSENTADVLIPAMKDCLKCHGSSGTHLDRCSECHLYHNKTEERRKDGRPADQLIGMLNTLSNAAWENAAGVRLSHGSGPRGGAR